MTITLRPEHEQVVAEAIQSGAYKTPEEVIGRALEALRSADESLHDDRGAIEAKIERAFAQFERGDFWTDEESRADMEARKAVWLADRNRK